MTAFDADSKAYATAFCLYLGTSSDASKTATKFHMKKSLKLKLKHKGKLPFFHICCNLASSVDALSLPHPFMYSYYVMFS